MKKVLGKAQKRKLRNKKRYWGKNHPKPGIYFEPIRTKGVRKGYRINEVTE